MPTTPAHSLATVPLFAGLDATALTNLVIASRSRHYAGGQILFSEGDPGDALLLLESGKILVSRFTLSGREIVLDELSAPAAVGELALIDDQPRSATITAVGAVTVRWLGRDAFQEVLDRDPALSRGLLITLARMVRATNERLVDALALDVPGRLAKWLLAHAATDGIVALDQSQGALALGLGTTRVTINRSLGRFERLGFVEIEGHSIRIRDRSALQVIADG